MFSFLLEICGRLSILISCCVVPMYAAEMTSIAEVQDEVCKVAGELEELSKRLQLEEDMPAAEKTRLWKTEDFLQQTALQLGQKELLPMQSGHHNLAKEILPQVMFLGLNCSLCQLVLWNISELAFSAGDDCQACSLLLANHINEEIRKKTKPVP